MTTQTVKLGEVCEINKASVGRDYAFDSIEYLDTSSVTNGCFSETEHLSLADAPSRAKRIVQNNDIVISTVRPNLRHFGIIQNAKPNMIVSTGFAVLTINESKADYSYIYYLLTKDDIVDYLSAVADQAVSTYPTFNPSVLANLDLILPPLTEQRRVAGILGSLDEKIENNRRLIRNLESLARALFKKHITRNEEKEGWKNATLGDFILELPKSKVKVGDAKDLGNGKYPFYTSGLNIFTWNEVMSDGFTVLLNTGGMADVKLGIGKIAFSTDTWAIKGKKVGDLFLYVLLSEMKEKIGSDYFEGTALKHLQKPKLKSLAVKLPPATVLQTFNAAVEPLFAEIGFLSRENQTLAATRDKLLRKLIK